MSHHFPTEAVLRDGKRLLVRPFQKEDAPNLLKFFQGLPADLRRFAWDEITDDIDDARIYGGIHFRFDQEAGARQGRAVGSYILRNYLRSEDE